MGIFILVSRIYIYNITNAVNTSKITPFNITVESLFCIDALKQEREGEEKKNVTSDNMQSN